MTSIRIVNGIVKNKNGYNSKYDLPISYSHESIRTDEITQQDLPKSNNNIRNTT